MNTLELRNIVISQILQIEDKSLLSAIKTILDISKPKSQIILTNEQKDEIEISRNEIISGQFKDNTVLDKEMRQWLGEK